MAGRAKNVSAKALSPINHTSFNAAMLSKNRIYCIDQLFNYLSDKYIRYYSSICQSVLKIQC